MGKPAIPFFPVIINVNAFQLFCSSNAYTIGPYHKRCCMRYLTYDRCQQRATNIFILSRWHGCSGYLSCVPGFGDEADLLLLNNIQPTIQYTEHEMNNPHQHKYVNMVIINALDMEADR